LRRPEAAMAPDTPDTRVADAINRVLEAERATAAAIEQARLQSQSVIEAARDMRRNILETARRRIVRLHELAPARLAAHLQHPDARPRSGQADEAESGAVADAAIARLAERLTTDDPP
jgi:cell division septum initiation protein DivIVA